MHTPQNAIKLPRLYKIVQAVLISLSLIFGAATITAEPKKNTRFSIQMSEIEPSAERVAEHELSLKFFTGDWCPPCKSLKKLLAREDALGQINLMDAEGQLYAIPIVYVDIPDPDHADRRKRGAIDIGRGPFIPQFHLMDGEERIAAFYYPWPPEVARRQPLKPGFSAARTMAAAIIHFSEVELLVSPVQGPITDKTSEMEAS